MKILDALERFVIQLEADGRSLHTIGQYRRHVRALGAWVGPRRAIDAVRHEDIARFLTAPVARTTPRGAIKKANSVNALRTSLRCFFAYARDVGWIRENPARLLRPAICGRPLPRALTDEESARLLAAIDHPRDHALFALMLATGIRVGSALALDVSDVDLVSMELVLYRAKGDRTERVYLPASVRDEVRRHIGGRAEGPLFRTRNGARLGPRQAHRRLASWLGKAGIDRPASPHSLRHTFATRLLRKTGDILVVQKALRHRNIESTLRYAALDDRRVREAIEG